MDKLLESLMQGKINEHVTVTVESTEGLPEGVTLEEAAKSDDKDKLPSAVVVTVEAIHAGMTKNKTFYPADKLESSVHTWTNPYQRPVIKNHDTWEEPTGRVVDAYFKESVLKPETKTIELKLRITDEDAIKKVLDGRYQTLSIGGSTNEARCSICAKNIVESGWCGHSKGKKYDGKEAYWIIGEMEFNEISWVNVPADVNARVVDVKPEEASGGRRSESVEDNQTPVVEESTELDLIDGILGEEQQTEDQTQVQENEQPEGEEVQVTEGEEQTPEGQVQENEETDTEKLEKALTRITELEAEAQTLTEASETLKAEKETAETSVTEKDAEITLLKEERDSFRNKNITLAKTAHKFLAESAVNLRVVLGEATKDDKEELVKEYAKTPAKVLESTIKDLLDKPAKQVREQATPAASPGVVVTEGAHSVDADGEITESTKQTQEKVEIDIEELANRMIGVIAQNGRF